MRNNKKLIYEQYNKIKNDTNNDVKIKELTQKLLDITGYIVQDNGTIFEFESDNPYGIDKGYYGDIIQQVEVLENENKIVITHDKVIKTIDKYDIKENDTPITIASKIIKILKQDSNSYLSYGEKGSKKITIEKPILNEDSNQIIYITPSGIYETFANFIMYKDKTIKEKINKTALMEHLDKLIVESKLTNSNELSRKSDKTTKYDTLMNVVKIDGEFNVVTIRIKKDHNNRFYIHSLETIKKEGVDRSNNRHLSHAPSSNNSINDKIEIVKKRINGIKDKG